MAGRATAFYFDLLRFVGSSSPEEAADVKRRTSNRYQYFNANA
jgi:hypothetical protein